MNYKIARNFALGIFPGLMLLTAPVSASTDSALTHISSQSIIILRRPNGIVRLLFKVMPMANLALVICIARAKVFRMTLG